MGRKVDCPGPVDESNFFEWECYISGPEGTPFEGGIFPATLTFPKVCIPSPFLLMHTTGLHVSRSAAYRRITR
jgi:ubiquitin-protein ligase